MTDDKSTVSVIMDDASRPPQDGRSREGRMFDEMYDELFPVKPGTYQSESRFDRLEAKVDRILALLNNGSAAPATSTARAAPAPGAASASGGASF